MRIGVALPQTGSSALVIDDLDRYLGEVEAAQVDEVWVTEQLYGAVPRLEPLVLLAYAASRTSKVRLGTAILLGGIRNPVQMARSLASLDHLSRGRLDVGLGLGGDGVALRAAGEPAAAPDRGRGAHLEAVITTVLDLWRAQPLSEDPDRPWDLTGRTVAPGPRQHPHPPLLLGGTSPAALDRAARLADGWIGAGNATIESFSTVLVELAERAEAVGRGDRPLSVTKRQYVAITDDIASARRRAEDWYRSVYPGRDSSHVRQVVVAGPPSACVEELTALAARGAEAVILSSVLDDPDQTSRLLHEVVPAVRESLRQEDLS